MGRQESEGEFSFALLPPLPSPFLLLSSEPASEEVARSQVRAARVSSLIDSWVTKKFLRFWISKTELKITKKALHGC